MRERAGRWTDRLFLVLILFLAAGLRLTRLDLVEFKYDEATTARSALAIAREGRLPAVGMISSRGPRNPALMSYVLALPFALSRDPRLAAGWVAFLGVVAVGLAYRVGRAYFGRRVGALAALLFAASPWAVFHSRKIWAQNLPALTLLFIAAVLALVVRRRPWALAGALAAAGCLVSLHLGGLVFFLMLALIGVLFHRHVRPVPLLVGLLLLALILSPYLLHDARQGWPNLRAFASLTDQAEATWDLQSPRMAALITGGYHLEDLAGVYHADFVASMLDLRWLDQVEMAFLWAGLAWLAGSVLREALGQRGCLSQAGAARLVLLCWFCLPLALLLRHDRPVRPHDFNLLYPAQHLIVALFLVDVVEWGRRSAQENPRPAISRALLAVAGLLVVALVGWQVYWQEALLTFVDSHDTRGGYGPPLKYALAAARQAETLLAGTAEAQAGAGGAELIALLPGAVPRHDGQAAVFDVLIPPYLESAPPEGGQGGAVGGRRLVDGRQALVLPDRPAVFLAHPNAEPAVTALAGIASEAGPALPLRSGSEAAYRFFRWPPTAPGQDQPPDASPPHAWGDDPARWASGAMLLGYDWSGDAQPGGAVRWTLYWRVEGQPPAGSDNVHWFNHLVDREGNRWGQADGVGYPVSEWRPGDVVLTWFDIAVSPDAPAPPYFVRTGMYTYPDVVNVPLLDAHGGPAGEFVELGPIGP